MSTEQNNKDAELKAEQQASATETEKQDDPAGQQTENDTPDLTTVTDQPESAPDKSTPVKSTPVKSGRSGWIIPLLAMFLLFAGGGVLLWLEQQQLGQRLQQSEQRSATLQTRLDKSQHQQLQASNANSELQRSIQAMRDLVMAQQQAPQQDETTLLLHQTLMLVRMAQAQLQVRHNVADAVLAMQWAQQRLQASRDVSIAPVLAQLERDIQQLRNLPERNNLALAQQLASLIDAVDKLPLRVAAAQPLESVTVPGPQPQVAAYTDWRSALQIIWQELKQLVVIRHRELPLQPLMSAEREQILHDVLRLRLEALQVQLMREAVAAQNVARARVLSWLREWFDEGNRDVISMRDWLNSMPQTATALPDLQGSAAAVTAAMGQASSQTDPAP